MTMTWTPQQPLAIAMWTHLCPPDCLSSSVCSAVAEGHSVPSNMGAVTKMETILEQLVLIRMVFGISYSHAGKGKN